MDEDASRLQDQVINARERVGDDIGELTDRANVVRRAKHAVSEKIHGVKHAVGSAKEAVTGSLGNARGSVGGSIGNAQDAVGDTISGVKARAGAFADNPLGMMLAGLAVGMLAGLLIPLTRVEREKLQPLAEDVKERLIDAGQEAVARGQTVIKDTIEAGKQAAVSSAQEQAQKLGADLQSAGSRGNLGGE